MTLYQTTTLSCTGTEASVHSASFLRFFSLTSHYKHVKSAQCGDDYTAEMLWFTMIGEKEREASS